MAAVVHPIRILGVVEADGSFLDDDSTLLRCPSFLVPVVEVEGLEAVESRAEDVGNY